MGKRLGLAKARTAKNDKEEAGGRECEESRVEDRGSCRSNEMEGRYESDCGSDELYPATFGDEEKNGLKLHDDELTNTNKHSDKYM